MPNYTPAVSLLRTADLLGLPLTPLVDAASARLNALMVVQSSLAEQRTNVLAEVAEALTAAGSDTRKLARALTGTAAVQLATLENTDVRNALDMALYQADVDLRRTIRTGGDDLIRGWRPGVQQAGADLHAAAAALPTVETLDHLQAVVRSGSDASEHWLRATAALALLAQVSQMLDALNALGYVLAPQPSWLVRAHVVRMAELTWQQVAAKQATDLWSAVRSGSAVTLHTSDELAAVMARLVSDYERTLTPVEASQRKRRVPSFTGAGMT